MRVLVVTNMYPTPDSPSAGVFVRREVDALQALNPSWTIQVLFEDTVTSTARYLTGRLRVMRYARVFDPDVVHIHYGLTQLVSFGLNTPLVVTFHGSDLAIPWQRAISTGLLGSHAVPVVVAEAMKVHLRPGQAARAVTIPCGVDLELYASASRESARVKMGFSAEELVLGFPSSPARSVKRYRLFAETVALLERMLDCRIRTVCLEGVSPEHVPEFLAAVDLLLMTSEREGSPVVVREALAVRTRVVSTDVGDVAEYLNSFPGCRVVADASCEALATACRDALGEPCPDGSQLDTRFTMRAEAEAVSSLYFGLVRP
jgi:glycosyltransferase involved in cell wall biosynthesis